MPDTDTPTDVDHFTVRLAGWGQFNQFADPVRALVFGHMVKLAMPVMHEYQADLYHDATWLEQNLNGPMTFEWLIRPSGTNINNLARMQVEISSGEGFQFWRVRVFARAMGTIESVGNQASGTWYAEFTRIPLGDVPRST